MKTCDTCKFWNPAESQADAGWGGQCDHFKMLSEQKQNISEPPSDDSTVARAHDYYPAYLSTGPKFGCIHHEDL